MCFSYRRIAQTSHSLLFHTWLAQAGVWGRAANEIGSKLEAGELRVRVIDENKSVRKSNVKINVLRHE